MKNSFLFLCFLLSVLNAGAQYHAKADPRAMIVTRQARFTLLTDAMVRMEWSPDSRFEDRPSQVFLNRKMEVPAFTVDSAGGWLTISTRIMKISYKRDSGKFTAENLKIMFLVNGEPVTWIPGMTDSLNLKGTVRTLDEWNGGHAQMLEQGLISRSGWSLVDDSRSLLFKSDGPSWIIPRADTLGQDWYFFAYGHDYQRALRDFTKVAGKIPLPPRFAFGYWWSRYWVYSEAELRELVDDMHRFDIPLDVLVVDMDWHDTYGLNFNHPKKDPFGQWVGWTGYSWNTALFPDPGSFLQWKSKNHLKTALNLHPASGIAPMEKGYQAMARSLGVDTAGKPYIPFRMEDSLFAASYFKNILKPLEEQGVDFWWLDWQQWLEAPTMKGLSNTWWLNHTFFTNMQQEGKRPLLFHRWGGLGNHRYQIGFSGDAFTTWKMLAFEPEFTATASNVGYAYWSHDIGGHNPGGLRTDAELHLRWLQFGAFSPILRTHTTKSNLVERRVWMFPDHYKMMKQAIKWRYSLIPYIYTASRNTYDSGIAICHPMYYQFPEKMEAYEYQQQFYFGPDIIVSPVVSPCDRDVQLAAKKTWLPEGRWFEWSTGTVLEGDSVYYRQYSLDEVPVFVKAGALIPMLPEVENLDQPCDTMVLTVIPGGEGNTRIYEDDGNSLDYQKDIYTTTRVRSKLTGARLEVDIDPVQGNFQAMKDDIFWKLVFPNHLPPTSVTVNGVIFPYSASLQPATWSFQPYDASLLVLTGSENRREKLSIAIVFPQEDTLINTTNAYKGKLQRLGGAVALLKEAAEGNYFIPDWIYRAEQSGLRAFYYPDSAAVIIKSLNTSYEGIMKSLAALDFGNSQAPTYASEHGRFEVPGWKLKLEADKEKTLADIARRVQIQNPYKPKYHAGGKAALFDGKRGVAQYFDDAWQGYEGEDMVVTYDRGEANPVKELNASFLQEISSWIFFPVSVEFFISNDGTTFTSLGVVYNEISPREEGNLLKTYSLSCNPVKARWIRVKATGLKTCPSWHVGSGRPSWIFADEIWWK